MPNDAVRIWSFSALLLVGVLFLPVASFSFNGPPVAVSGLSASASIVVFSAIGFYELMTSSERPSALPLCLFLVARCVSGFLVFSSLRERKPLLFRIDAAATVLILAGAWLSPLFSA